MISIAELQLLACLVCGVVFAGFVFYWIHKKRQKNKVRKIRPDQKSDMPYNLRLRKVFHLDCPYCD